MSPAIPCLDREKYAKNTSRIVAPSSLFSIRMDDSIWSAIREGGRDPELALQRHESHAALAAANALLPARYTGTNVMDVVIGLVE